MKINIIRWVLLIPSVVVSWFLISAIGIHVYTTIESLCPSDKFISGICYASWWQIAEQIIPMIFIGLSAIVVVLVSALVAPKSKRTVTLGTYLIGCMFAILIAIDTQEWLWAFSAVILGGITTFFLAKKY